MIHKFISRHVPSDLDLSWVTTYNFDLNTHIILAEPRYPNPCPNGLMDRYPFLKIPHHRPREPHRWSGRGASSAGIPAPSLFFHRASGLGPRWRKPSRSVYWFLDGLQRFAGRQPPVHDVISTIYSFGRRGLVTRVDTLACAFDAITNADGSGAIEVSFCFLAPAVVVEVLEIRHI